MVSSSLEAMLRAHLHEPGTGFSAGSQGAIAEFHRGAEEALSADDPDGLMVATERGALAITLPEGVEPIAYETLSRRGGRWQQGVALCLPLPSARGAERGVITELGADADALRPGDRRAVLFDLGLGARNVDFCVRTDDPALLRALRRGAGRVLFEARELLGAIVEVSPPRVVLSRLARAEVYQAIARRRTPEGPHTHVLEKLIRSRRTHAANVPVPAGMLPCLSMYPEHPLADALGEEKPFCARAHAAFQDLLRRWGSPAYRAEKERLREAIRAGVRPADYDPPTTRLTRVALRVGLRQLRCTGDDPALEDWLARFDPPSS